MRKKKKVGSKPEIAPNQNAFVVGNGTSRSEFDLQPLQKHGFLVACNWFFRKEFKPDVLIMSDEPITNTFLKTEKAYPKQNWFFTWYPKPGSGAKKAPTPEKFAAGPMAACTAVEQFKANKVFLIGMDFFGFGSNGKNDNGKLNNLYAGEKHYTAQSEHNVAPTYRNWQRRYQWVLRNYPDVEFYHVAPFEGKSPERLIGAPNWHQVSWENLQAHLNEGAELVDMKEVTEDDVALFEEDNPDDIRASIERQFAGQENVVMPDRIHPQEFLKLRLQIQENYRRMGSRINDGGYLQIKVKDYDIMVPPYLIQTKNGIELASNDFIIASYQQEMRDRYERDKTKLEPFKTLAPKATPKQQNFGIAPPPPPPGFGDIPPPPPPPPVP